jgi:trans-aconitate 2-methyltransferase
VIDLGCGTGELSRILFDGFKPETMAGIDSSMEMLGRADEFKTGGLTFRTEDIASHEPSSKYDLVFSNAALQWLPHHEILIPKILSWIAENGQIAIQMPFNFDHPSHLIAHAVALKLFPSIFGINEQRSTLSLERYAEVLFEHGFKSQTCRIEIYGHPMASGNDVIEWTKGTLLTRYQSKLSDQEFRDFLEVYKKELLDAIGEGPYFYAFKRALIWGRKSEEECHENPN